MINLDCSLLIVQSSGRAKWAEGFFEAAFFVRILLFNYAKKTLGEYYA